jgi:UDP-N-acetylglucosamine 4,6-dehydratase
VTTTRTFTGNYSYHPLTVVITGGTGSLGTALTRFLLTRTDVGRVRIVSRDELKQSEMARQLNDERLRFFIGDVRDVARMQSALQGADVVIHAAAMKQVPACEYNPFEAVKTNILGTENIIGACLDQGVDRAVFISSDKAVDPVNHYGATKKVAEKLWLYGNNSHHTKFSLTRWGNVLESRGSVIPIFRRQAQDGVLTLTHKDMTRFWLSLDEAVQFLWSKVETMKGGEVFIPELKSARVLDIAKTIAPHAQITYTGIREGEKLHETLGPGYFSNDKKRLMSKRDIMRML